MKRITLLIVLLFIFTSIILGQSKEGFRGIPWGASREDVISIEGDDFRDYSSIDYQTEDLTYYRILGRFGERYTKFNFDNNKLIEGLYGLTNEYNKNYMYLDDFNYFENMLIEKYGTPKIQQVRWLLPVDKTKIDLYGFYILSGSLEYYNEWETENTIIIQELSVYNNNIFHFLTYKSKLYYELLNIKNNKEVFDNL